MEYYKIMEKKIRNAVLLFMSVLSGFTVYGRHNATKENVVRSYSAPKGLLMSSDFAVKVKAKGSDVWQQVPVYIVKVAKVENLSQKTEQASVAYFDFSGSFEVTVTPLNRNIERARIRPLSYGITHTERENKVMFSLNEPSNLSIEINDDIFHNLHLFANPLNNQPKKMKTGGDLIYFGPGIHEIPGGKLNIKSGQEVYISGGAFVKGQINVEGVSDVKIHGIGIIDQEVRLGIYIANSKNVEVDGIICSQCFVGVSNGVKVRNTKSISYFGWGDGMNVMVSNNISYDWVFNRNSDDCSTVYATRKGFTGGGSNIRMENATLWSDVAHPILIGTHGNAEQPDTIQNVLYHNIDILDHHEMQIDYQGCMAINAGDSNFIKNITFSDIRVEDFRKGQLVNLRVFYNEKYCTSPGKGIQDVVFRNITYNGAHAGMSVISGYDETRDIRNVVFENLRINGCLIYDQMPEKPKWYKTADLAGFFIG